MLINLILKELKNFIKNNWWIFIILFICLFFVWKTNYWNIYEVIILFIVQFAWDLCVMIMWDYYSKINWKDKKQDLKYKTFGLYAQTISFIIFGFIWLYAGFYKWTWSYLLPQLLFIRPLIQWYLELFNIKFKITWKFSLFVWILLFWIYYFLWLITNIWILIQVLWFIMFPIALILNNEKRKYFLSLIWIFFIFLGSLLLLINGFFIHNISWVDVSYTLLPFTVFVFYLKNLKKYL